MPGGSSPTRAGSSSRLEVKGERGSSWGRDSVVTGSEDRARSSVPGSSLAGLPLRGGPIEASSKARRRTPPPRRRRRGPRERGRGLVECFGTSGASVSGRAGPPQDNQGTWISSRSGGSLFGGPPTERPPRDRRPPRGASFSVVARTLRCSTSSGGEPRSSVRSARQGFCGSCGTLGWVGRVPISLTKTEAASRAPRRRGRSRARPPRQRVCRLCGETIRRPHLRCRR